VFVAERRHRLGIGLLAAAMVALSACSAGGSGPRTLPALSTTPAADASSNPPTSRAAELAAVKAVVRRYYALLNAPTTVANAKALAALMTPDCECRRVAESTRQIAERNQHYFGRVRLIAVTPALDGSALADALVQYDYSDGGIRTANGEVVSRSEGRRGTLLSFRFRRIRGLWLISEVVVVRKGSR
jgi:hypothetical protein